MRGGARYASWLDGALLWTDVEDDVRLYDPRTQEERVIVDGERLRGVLEDVYAPASPPPVAELFAQGTVNLERNSVEIVVDEQRHRVDLSGNEAGTANAGF